MYFITLLLSNFNWNASMNKAAGLYPQDLDRGTQLPVLLSLYGLHGPSRFLIQESQLSGLLQSLPVV